MLKSWNKMKKKQKKIQLTLISLGLLLFVLTYLYYPSLNKVEDFKDEVVEEHDLLAFEDIKRLNIFSRLIKSINFLIWGDV